MRRSWITVSNGQISASSSQEVKAPAAVDYCWLLIRIPREASRPAPTLSHDIARPLRGRGRDGEARERGEVNKPRNQPRRGGATCLPCLTGAEVAQAPPRGRWPGDQEMLRGEWDGANKWVPLRLGPLAWTWITTQSFCACIDLPSQPRDNHFLRLLFYGRTPSIRTFWHVRDPSPATYQPMSFHSSLTMAHKRRMPMIPQLHKTVILNASWIEVDVHLN
jgi:hypothetical protein